MGGAIYNYSGADWSITDCYWGTNNPVFNNSLIYNVTINTYLILEITTEYNYIKVQAKQYNTSTSSTSTYRVPLGSVEATITVGDQIYTKTFRNGIVRQAYAEPSKPYDISVKLADGEVLTKTITA